MVSAIVYGAFCMLLGVAAFSWFVLMRLPRWMLASALVFIDGGAAILAVALIPGNARFLVAGVFGVIAVGSSIRASILRRQWRREGSNWTRSIGPGG
jgi:hypothetical protein